jgi:hypothetical protein
MKRVLVLAVVLALTAGIGAAFALPGVSVDAAISVPFPTGDFADGNKTGIGAGVDVFAGLPLLPLKLGGRVAYDRFAHKVGSGNTQIIEVLPSVRYELVGLPLGVFNFFGQLGAGLYTSMNTTKILGVETKKTENKFGLSVGVGASAMSFMVMPMYHIIFSDKNTSYISLNVGMRF